MQNLKCKMISQDIIKRVVKYWDSNSSEACLLDHIYSLIPGKEGLRPALMSLQVLCELFDFSNSLLGTWRDEFTVYSSDTMLNDTIVLDGKFRNCVAVHISDTDPVFTSLINLRQSILTELSYHTPTPSDWEFIVSFNVSDVCKHVYLLMYGFRNKDDIGSVTGDFKKDIMELYKKVNKYALDILSSPSGPVSIRDQSVSFSVCSKILELIDDVLFELGKPNGEKLLPTQEVVVK